MPRYGTPSTYVTGKPKALPKKKLAKITPGSPPKMSKAARRTVGSTVRAVANWVLNNSSDEAYIDAAWVRRHLETVASEIEHGTRHDLSDALKGA